MMSKAMEDVKKIVFCIELKGIRCYGEEFRNIIKELQAFEIIKNKSINVDRFKSDLISMSNFTYKDYINNCGKYHNGMKIELLDENEFNNLKEVLSYE